MKRKKPAKPVQIDLSVNGAPLQPGYVRGDLNGLQKMYGKVDAILADGVLELLEGEERINALYRMYRALKTGGTVKLTVAHWATAAASMSPFCKWPPLSPESFGFFSADVRKRSNFTDKRLAGINFDLTWSEMYTAEWETKSDLTRSFAAKHYTNALQGLVVTLTKKELA